jgi:hypothetical protein
VARRRHDRITQIATASPFIERSARVLVGGERTAAVSPNMPLVPTRNGDALLLAAQRRRYVAQEMRCAKVS